MEISVKMDMVEFQEFMAWREEKDKYKKRHGTPAPHPGVYGLLPALGRGTRKMETRKIQDRGPGTHGRYVGHSPGIYRRTKKTTRARC